MRILKTAGVVLLVSLVVAQFIRPDRNLAAGRNPSAIGNRFPVPENVSRILERSCNDCHSDNTVYPWYAHLQPLGWWLADHIDEGRGNLNFDRFLDGSAWRQYHKFEEVREMIELDEMPLPSYLIIHRDAVLTQEEATILLDWSDAMRDSMTSWYPPDSLRRPGR